MQTGSKGNSSVEALLRAGPRCSSGVDRFHAHFTDCRIVITESILAEIIVRVVSLSDGAEKWNLSVVGEVLEKMCKTSRRPDWNKVVRNVDHYNFRCTETCFTNFASLFRAVSGTKIPADSFGNGSLWENTAVQLFLLKCAVLDEMKGNMVNFENLITLGPSEHIQGAVMPANLSVLCLPLFNTILELGSRGVGLISEVKTFLMQISEKYPEYAAIMLAQAQSTEEMGALKEEVLLNSMKMFTSIRARPTAHAVVTRLLRTNVKELVWACRMLSKQCYTLSGVVRLEAFLNSVDAGIMRGVEERGLPDELMPLWCARARKSMGPALAMKMQQVLSAQPAYARPMAMFLRYHGPEMRVGAGEDSLLDRESYGQILQLLQQYPNFVSKEEILELSLFTGAEQEAQQRYSPADKTSAQEEPPSSASGGDGEDSVADVSNAHYMRLYSGQVSVEDTVNLLRCLKGSSEQKEQEVFRCMLHNLLDEYRYFQYYKDPELSVTAQIFGSLIKNQLISSITLGIALRYILEALRMPADGDRPHRMFIWGRTTIEEFRGRLSEWPQYCAHLLQIPKLIQFAPQLHEDARTALNDPGSLGNLIRTKPITRAAVGPLPSPLPAATAPVPVPVPVPAPPAHDAALMPPPAPSSAETQAGVAALSQAIDALNLNMDPLLPSILPLNFNPLVDVLPEESMLVEDRVAAKPSGPPALKRIGGIDTMVKVNVDPALNAEIPPNQVSDPIVFIINNIGQNNYEQKSLELKAMLHTEHFTWFASYLVSKRIAGQPNLHGLYLAVLDTIGFGANANFLYNAVLGATYFQITKLLQSPDITTSSSERSLLRNLGMWLGAVTLARNRPILQRRMDLKELVFWGYETGRLIAVCSFVAKVLEGVRDSGIFRPPNPWLMGVLGVLRDLYELEDLKMNIKFEVQVLCKNIHLRIEDVPKADLIAQCTTPTMDRDGRRPDFNLRQNRPSSDASPPVSAGGSPALTGITADAGGASKVGPEAGAQLSIPSLNAYIVVNSGLAFFKNDPGHRRLVAMAVERAIREIIQPVVERSSLVAVTTTKSLVLKDYATEGNENQLRKGAHVMVSQMASSLALVNCREPLRNAIDLKLRSLLLEASVAAATVDQVVNVVASENLELGCALVEKAAVEKAIRDMDSILTTAYSARRNAREAGVPFVDKESLASSSPANPALLAEIPEALKPQLGGVQPHQQALYDYFRLARANDAAQQTGVQASGGDVNNESKLADMRGGLGGGAGTAGSLSTSQALEAYTIVMHRIDAALRKVQQQAKGREIGLSMLGVDHEIMVLLRDVILVSQRVQASVRLDCALNFAESLFKRMVEEPKNNAEALRLDVIVGTLEALRDACGGAKKFQPDLSAWLSKYATFNITDDTNRKVHLATLLRLLRVKLLKSPEVDLYLAAQIDGGRNLYWLEISLAFVRQCLLDGTAATFEFPNVFDTVSKVRPPNAQVRKQLEIWLTDLRRLAAGKDEQKSAENHQGSVPAQSQQAGVPLPPSMQTDTRGGIGGVPGAAGVGGGLRGGPSAISKDVVTNLLERWLSVWTNANEQVFAQYLQVMHSFGVLKTIEAADKFFRVALEVTIAAFEKSAQQAGEDAKVSYVVMDALSRLFILLMRLADKEAGAAQLLWRILNAVTSTLVARYEVVQAMGTVDFDQRPFFRVLSNLLLDLGEPSAGTEPKPKDLALLSTYSQVFLSLTPQKIPGFAFSWVQLICHRRFMPHLLQAAGQKGWPTMHRLLVSLLSFLQPFLRDALMTDAIRKLYESTVRIILVILHDFPEFLCDHHASLCDAIPASCVQLRNLVLSAFPRSMRLPDPFSVHLKVDELEAMRQPPRVLSDYTVTLGKLRTPLEMYLNTKQPRDFLQLLPAQLRTGPDFNVPLVNALVLHVGAAGSKGMTNITTMPLSPAMVVLKHLVTVEEPEGRYILLNAMANQLRYPNSHTHFFSYCFLHLFSEADNELVQEQITRVLLERLIVHRPHPWGLLVTFIELIKNPRYNFWRGGFTKGAPEIEKVFDTVARSCIGTSAAALEAAAAQASTTA